nr:hypothetical protein [uncultured Roseateles sp.]
MTTVASGMPGAAQHQFTNPDGGAASWVEVIPLAVRKQAFAVRFLSGLALASLLWITQYANGVLGQDYFLVGLIPLAIGGFSAKNAYDRAEVRRYSVGRVQFSVKQRLLRAWKYWAFGAALLALVWGLQMSAGQFQAYWWYAWPALFPLFVGTGLYLLRGEVVLTPDAAKAKSHYDAVAQQARQAGQNPTAFDRFVEIPLVRYAAAILLLVAAYSFGTDTGKNSGWAAFACVFLAGLCAREVSKWLLILAVGGAIAWGLFAGIAALPVSVAVIIGALIIASTLKK